MARAFLLCAVFLAVAVQLTWLTDVDDRAGVRVVTSRSGAATMPILDGLILIQLAAVLGLFLLPRLLQRGLLLLTLVLAAVSLWKVVAWAVTHSWRLPQAIAISAIAATMYVGFHAMRSAHTPAPLRADAIDPWRALDRGVDPTIDE